jgi:hypothetical protein
MKIVLQPTGEQVRAFRDLKGCEGYQLYTKAFGEIMGPRGVRTRYFEVWP